MRISKVFLYDEPGAPEIEIDNLAKFIIEKTGFEVQVRKSFFDFFNAGQEVAHKLASVRIFNPYIPFEKHEPTSEEVSFEEEPFANRSILNNIILYDGFELQNIVRNIITDSELASDMFHLVFTARLTCTYDCDDYRYHGRAVICSNPSIISTTGIIEAPAKPRKYYLASYENITRGLNLDSVKNQFRGRFLEFHDKNLGRVVRGYALQAIFYYLTSKPFCESKDCMLYNAHWQEELLHSQIEISSLCENHQKILDELRQKSE